MKSKRQIENAIKKILSEASEEYERRDEKRKSFGDCYAATANHWTAYGLEIAAELLAYYLLRKEVNFRNGERPMTPHERGRL